MTGTRAYLDWNAGAPLRPEARAALLAALEIAGNPSSVHAEGRAARTLVERARAQVAEALGVGAGRVVFTSGASEAAALGLAGRELVGAGIEHDCVAEWIDPVLPVDRHGRITVTDPGRTALQAANSETGVLQETPPGLGFVDAVQVAGKLPYAFEWSGAAMAIVSAHKLGGPKGVGALLLAPGAEPSRLVRGGGQEEGLRAGTENVPGIAGFGAACAAAVAEVADGTWERVAALRNNMEAALEAGAQATIFVGKDVARLPNTSCIVVPGWKGETQVMQMDLAGFAISAGSACSSGKVRASRVLRAMGLSGEAAGSAIRVSLGPATSEAEVFAFVAAWEKCHRRMRRGAAAAA